MTGMNGLVCLVSCKVISPFFSTQHGRRGRQVQEGYKIGECAVWLGGAVLWPNELVLVLLKRH